MHSYVLYIAKVLGILTTIVILTLLFTSDTVERMYWEQISETSNSTWNTYTLEGGSTRYEAYTEFLNSVDGGTFEATGE